jgi:plastocyanin
MAAYYVLGGILVAWALGLSALGLTRKDFPPSGPAGRAIVGATVLIVVGILTALLVTTNKEHPREEAAAKAAELKAGGQKETSGGSGTAPGTPAAGGQKTVDVTEKEFSIALAGGNDLKAGSYTFAAHNAGKIQHDLVIDGDGLKGKKTPLIDSGKTANLAANLKAGKYKLYCSVPGHEQSGMKVEVTVK